MGNVIDPNRKPGSNEQPLVDPDDPSNIPKGFTVEKYEDYRGVTYSKDADLEAMYARPSQDKTERLERRIRMETPIERKTNWPLITVFLVILAVVGGALALVKRPMVDALGEEHDVPLGLWIYQFSTRTPRIKELMEMAPEYRAYYITEERAQLIYEIAAGMQARREKVLTPTEMATARKIDRVQARDAWGNEFRIDSTIGMIVRSAGPDGLTNTADDLVIRDGRISRPPAYENQRISSGAN